MTHWKSVKYDNFENMNALVSLKNVERKKNFFFSISINADGCYSILYLYKDERMMNKREYSQDKDDRYIVNETSE